uniref:MelB protein n=1 Tax=Melittangium lichenicola TaxID=45 RepID=Q70P98_9BACT|nr:MelB protein [Melittangium lichenicola]
MHTRQIAPQIASSGQEPLAIVGMACRLPGGVRHPEEFWKLLAQGVDAVREVPSERWSLDAWYDPNPEAPGKTYSRHGGFLSEVDAFDASFFGISAPEARSMDPQQRLLLELSWEALEDAGVVAERIKGTPTGVFLGICLSDYAQLELNAPDPRGINPYSGSGGVLSMAAGRIAATLGLEGPALVVDTSCSSSLVATHLACQSLRAGECDLALVGGANLLLSPRMTVYFSKLKALSPDGACKAFDGAANGYVRSEGAGVVVLKRLSDAIAAGDSIFAVVRGSAVNQDGRTNRLTAPHQAAQERVIERALGQGGIAPHEVGYVEAHGAGSLLADSVEVKALAAVLGRQRAASAPVGIGSVKTNLGHLEGAAGIASLIKVALALRHRALPRSLHFKDPSPHIPWAELPVEVISEHRPWSVAAGQRRIAGVSALGLSGTNAHVVLEEAPEPARRPVAPGAEERAELLVLSARTPRALSEAAQRLSAQLSSPEAESAGLRALSYSTTCHREHHGHRLAVASRSRRDAVGALEAFQRGLAHPDLQSGSVRPGPAPRVAFLFSGQGGHWPGTGSALIDQEPVFRDAVLAADAVYQRIVGWSLIEEWRRDKPRFDLSRYSQPAHVALQMGLAALLRSWGIVPDAIVGSSIGEVSSAYTAGVLSLEDAMLVTHASGELHTDIGDGAMSALELSEEEARAVIAPYGDRLSIAALNSPSSTLLSGEAGAMEELVRELTARGISARQMGIRYASHSPAVEPRRPAMRRALGSLRLNAPTVPLYTTVTGERAKPGDFDAEHWTRNYRQTVRFAPVIATLAEQGFTLFIEIGPNAVLARPVQQCFQKLGKSATVLSPLRRGEPEHHTLRTLLGGFYAAGGTPSWAGLFPEGGERVPLPSYPWQRERYWVAGGSAALQPVRSGTSAVPASEDAPAALLADRLQSLPTASTFGTGEPLPSARALADMPAEERLARVESFLRAEVARQLELTQDLSDWSLPLVRFGFDSLMGMKIKARIEQTLGISVSTARLLSGLCLPDLVTLVIEQLAVLPPESALDEQMEEFRF